jgi:hypothetical protein
MLMKETTFTIFKKPSSYEELFYNASKNYTSQFKSSKKSYNNHLFYFHHRNGKYLNVIGFQIKNIDEKLKIVFLLDYSQKFIEDFDVNYHMNIISPFFIGDDIKVSVFKNKNFNKNIYYADDIKKVLFKYLFSKYPNATIISEFKIFNTIVDIALFDRNTIIFYEIKSSQDSFSRLQKQIEDYKLYSNYTYLVLDDSKIKNYLSNNLIDGIGLLSFKKNKIILKNKIKKSKIKKSLLFLLWSKELKSSIRSIPYASKLNSSLTEIYFYWIFNSINEINKYVLFVLQNRYKTYSDNIKNSSNLNNVSLSKGFIKPFENNRIIDFLDRDIISIKSILNNIENNFYDMFFNHDFLCSLLDVEIRSTNDLKEKNIFVSYRQKKLNSFISFALSFLDINRGIYGDFEVKFFLFFLYKKKLLDKIIVEFKNNF